MIKLYDGGVFLREGTEIVPEAEAAARGISKTPDEARRETIAYSILQAHNTSGDPGALKIRFDAMASHDITFVGIIQTARASGMTEFPLPYVLTNCHNNFALWAAPSTRTTTSSAFCREEGTVASSPPHIAVIHLFMRENFAGCGKMILGSDSRIRATALSGTMAIGEGGGELAKQLLRDTYGTWRTPALWQYIWKVPLKCGVGPHDVALPSFAKCSQRDM